MTSLTVPARFNGPPESGNGGWTCGLVAEAAAARGLDVVTVSLKAPPPLDVAMTLDALEGDEAGLVLSDGDRTVAVARPGRLLEAPDADPGPAVALDDAQAAEARYPGHRRHPFPTCFVCGPDRAPGDGLRIFPGRLDDGRVASTWVPHPSVARRDGTVGTPVTWAALDCVGGWSSDLENRPMVLAAMTAELVGSPPQAGTAYVVAGRLVRTEGRKTWTVSGMYDAAGVLAARAAHLWIAFA
jgi:hypothetical protein